MHKDLLVASIISKDLQSDHSETLTDYNLSWVFEPLRELNLSIEVFNTLVCAIVYSYHPESKWVDLKHDGFTINKNIIKGLGGNENEKAIEEFITLENEKINESKGNFLDTLSGSWEFVTARSAIDVHAKTMRLSDEFTNLTDDEKKLKAKTELSKLRRDTILQRQTADSLIEKLRKDFVITDERVKTDYGLSFVDENVKRNSWSWREFIKYDYPKLKQKNHMVQKTKEAQN